MPELERSHFEGIRHPHIEFVIQHTELCEIISRVMRKRWALRSPPQARIAASKEADDALARFIISLPPSCHLSFSDLDPWVATLHLTYNNFIVLLHRPAAAESSHDDVAEVCTDLRLCGNATVLIASILETLRERTTLSSLWLYSVHTLFTATIHAGVEVNSSNSIVAAKAHKTFESLMRSLKVLSQHWRFAGNVLRLFEQRLPTLPPVAQGETTGSVLMVPDVRAKVGTTNTSCSIRPVTPTTTAEAPRMTQYAETLRDPHWKDNARSVGTAISDLSISRADAEAMAEDVAMNYASFPVSPSLEQFLWGMDFNILDY